MEAGACQEAAFSFTVASPTFLQTIQGIFLKPPKRWLKGNSKVFRTFFMLFINQGQQENINSGYIHTFSVCLGFFFSYIGELLTLPM